MRRAPPIAEEAVGAHGDPDDQPPVIPRYDPAVSVSEPPRAQPIRQVYTGQQVIRQKGGSGNVIFLKSTDGGTQKMMVRPTKPEQYRDYTPGTVLSSTGGARVIAVKSQQQQAVRQIYTTAGGAPRYVRVQSTGIPTQRASMDPVQVVRRVVHNGHQRQVFQEYMDHESSPGPSQPSTNNMRYILQSAVPQPSNPPTSKMQRLLPRGGMTMQMIHAAQNPDHRRLLAGRNKQKVTTYRDFMASRGYLESSKFMYGKLQSKPTFLPFEFNEEEEREINEAIAREEEWMRLEEESKISAYDSAGNPIRSFTPSSEPKALPYVSNLLPSVNDTADDKVIKQVLDVMFSQVCRWDRQYGWSKTHLKRARQKNDNEKMHLRKVRMSQREVLISEHMDRLKKEINKRRTKMENEAEQMCGMLTPWRKSRSRPNRFYTHKVFHSFNLSFKSIIMVLQTVFLPTSCYTVPSGICNFSNLSLSCAYEQQEKEQDSNLENEIFQILPRFASADQDWNSFGYLLDEQPTTSQDVKKRVTVFQKPVEPIGKGTRRRRRNADMEIAELASKPKTEVKKEVINPADITLGGDTFDYKEKKPLDSIASGVARRRRTSANLSKSEDDHEKSTDPAPTTRGNKERRTSEPPAPRITYYSPSFGSPVDIDMAVPHCSCQVFFDPSQFYVCCDMCARWYHGSCTGITEKMCQKLEQWTCEQCIEEQERVKEEPALYCVCKKPYDDTKFYVGCDSCQGWFHPECVGTTREDAEQAAEYNCPNCIVENGYESEGSEASCSSMFSVQLTRADYTYVMELLELLLEHRMSTPFRHPVDPNECPDYEKFVKKPMDLTTISRKVEQTEYLYLGQFVNDVNLMFENAKTYNPKDNAVFKCAETMQEVFDKKLYDVREQMTARQQMIQFQQQQNDPMSSARKRVQSESQKTVDSLDIDSDQLLPLDANFMSQLFDY
uniref:CFAP91 domain-containing protein n=1 Tax=Caenorhabditis tropicalis TaxID=1561998 RepID=A0A1I7U7M3_9PELO